MVEFSIIGIVLFLILFGLIEVGRGVWYYNTASSLSREGARWGTVMSQTIEWGPGNWCLAGNAPGTYDLSNTASYDQYTIVWRVAQLDIGMEPENTRVTIEHDLPCPDPGFSMFVRGWPINITVEHDYTPVLASFLGLSTPIQLNSESQMLLE